MNNGRFYKIVIILLLLLNGGILTYLWMKGSKPEQEHAGGHPGHGSIDKLMSDKLHFTAEQEQQMQVLKDEHHGQIMEIQKEEQQLHKQLFQLLQNGSNDTIAKNMLMAQLGANDVRKEEVTFEHFRKIRALLKAEQLPMFDELMEEIAAHIMAPHKGSRDGMPPPKEAR